MTAFSRTAARSARSSIAVVAAAVVVALAIWTLARLLGVELTVGKGPDPRQVGAIDVLVTALLAGLAAWGAKTLLVRGHAARRWPLVGSTALAISIIGPTYLADGLAGVVLICMHVAVGLVLIAGFGRLLPRLTDQRLDAWR